MTGKQRVLSIVGAAFIALFMLSACFHHHDRGLHRGHYKNIDKGGPGRR